MAEGLFAVVPPAHVHGVKPVVHILQLHAEHLARFPVCVLVHAADAERLRMPDFVIQAEDRQTLVVLAVADLDRLPCP